MRSFQMQSTNILRSVGGCPAGAGDPFFVYRPKDVNRAIEGRIRAIAFDIRVMMAQIRVIHPKIRAIEYNKESVTK